MRKSFSYPIIYKSNEEKNCEKKIIENTLSDFVKKDHERTQMLADIGSPSSKLYVPEETCYSMCGRYTRKVVNYYFRTSDEDKKFDEIMRQKSYAGFYYFVKWFVYTFFIFFISTIGTVIGKEIGCLIKDGDICSSTFVELTDSSPHIISYIFGGIGGIFTGDFIGRYIWNKMAKSLQYLLRRLEKLEDESKIFLILFSIFVYLFISTIFAVVFLFFIKLGLDNENIYGGVIGGSIGMVCACIAYRKVSPCGRRLSNCKSGQPMTPRENRYNPDDNPDEIENIPEINI